MNSCRYAIYFLYSGVLLYSAKSLIYLSFIACACDSNGSFSDGDKFCQFSPTSLAISVKVRLRPLRSSRISSHTRNEGQCLVYRDYRNHVTNGLLLEKRTYADGGRSGAFSSGWPRYRLSITGFAALVSSASLGQTNLWVPPIFPFRYDDTDRFSAFKLGGIGLGCILKSELLDARLNWRGEGRVWRDPPRIGDAPLQFLLTAIVSDMHHPRRPRLAPPTRRCPSFTPSASLPKVLC